MLLFGHKKYLQSYKAQSPIQKEIFYLTEITFQKLQRLIPLDYNAPFPAFSTQIDLILTQYLH